MIEPDQFYRTPNALAPFYSRFNLGKRLLLTGHSHQAWPDCGFEAMMQSWLDAAQLLDHKWDMAFAKANCVREGFAHLLDCASDEIALGPSVHDLLVRFLSALPFQKRPRIITSDGEFHSVRRQLDRVEEEGIEIIRVPSFPASNVAEELIARINDRTAAVIVSSVFFKTGEIVPDLSAVLRKCLEMGAEMLVDAYHSLNVVPFSLKQEGLDGAFITGGGYKYCQMGEGNCFLRVPRDCRMRPVITGWFSEFDALTAEGNKHPVFYGAGPSRFAGSTYDPASNYRGAEVFAFFEKMNLSPELLREVNSHQVKLLAENFDGLNLNPALIVRNYLVSLESIGGFLVLHSARAGEICERLYERGVYADSRGSILRLGPAPYLCDAQLIEAVALLGAVCSDMGDGPNVVSLTEKGRRCF
jgi:kynureninase